MNEQFIIDKLIIHGIHYNKFGRQEDETFFSYWMFKLQELKGFKTINEACSYFLSPGERRAA